MSNESTQTGWGNYFAAIDEAPAPAVQAPAPAPEAATPAFSDAQIDALKTQFMTLPPEQQASIVQEMAAQGIQGPQDVAAYLQNAMSATATGLDLAIERGELDMSQSAGRTSVSDADVERVVARAEAVATQMIASGASDKEIQQAVAQLPGNNLEVAAVVEAKVQQQLDADKFNMFSTRNADDAQQSAGAAAVLPTVGALLGAGAATSVAAAEPNAYGVTAERMPFQDIPPAQFFAALGNLSAPQTPNVAIDRGQGMGLG